MNGFSTTSLYWILTNFILWLLEHLILYPILNVKISQSRTVSPKNIGVIIDNKLDFTEHLNTVCKKANLKLHALNRISRFLSPEQHVLIINAYIKSLFNYCPLIWKFSLPEQISIIHDSLMFPKLTYLPRTDMDWIRYLTKPTIFGTYFLKTSNHLCH